MISLFKLFDSLSKITFEQTNNSHLLPSLELFIDQQQNQKIPNGHLLSVESISNLLHLYSIYIHDYSIIKHSPESQENHTK